MSKPTSSTTLRKMFLACARTRLRDPETRSRIQYFADHANSFEAWFNWELAHAFQARHPWPGFSAHREYRLPTGGLVDIAVYQGRDASTEGPMALFETKFVWNNVNATKQIASAFRDRQRIADHGCGALIIVAISAQHPNHPDLYTESADALIERIELGAELIEAPRSKLLSFDVDPSAGWYVAPSLRIFAYQTDSG